jgi:predicted RNase H-like HicB family nuclease
MKYHFKIYEEEGGFWAECLELKGLQTQGDTMEELEFNMKEVLDLYLSEPGDSRNLPILPKTVRNPKLIVQVTQDTSIDFKHLTHEINQKKE